MKDELISLFIDDELDLDKKTFFSFNNIRHVTLAGLKGKCGCRRGLCY